MGGSCHSSETSCLCVSNILHSIGGGRTRVVDRLDLGLFDVVPQVTQGLLTALLPAGHVLMGKLSSVRLSLLLLISELLQDEHLALLISSKLFVLLAVERGEGRRGRRDRLVLLVHAAVVQHVAIRVKAARGDARVESGVGRRSGFRKLVQLVVFLCVDTFVLFQVLGAFE